MIETCEGRSMAEPETIRFTVTIDKTHYRTIGELAERMGVSQAKMAALLLEAGVQDNEWVIRMVTSRVANGLREVFGASRSSKRKPNPST